MKLTEISLKRPVTVFMFFVSLTVIGVIAERRLPLESLPDIEFPYLFIQIPYRNSTPEEVERRIARPVEEVLATLPGVEHIKSESKDDGAQIFMQFAVGTDMAAKGVEARDKIDGVRASLPADVERVQVQKFTGGSQPMLTLRLSADRDLSGAYDMLERNLKQRVERLPGVAHVELYGVEKKQVRVQLIADRIAAHGVDLRSLAEKMKQANFSISAGDLIESGTRYFVKPEGRFNSLDDVRNFVVDKSGLRLSDIAEVRYAQPEQTYGRHLNRRYAVGLDVFKETGANLVAVADRVKAEIEDVKKLPEMAGIGIIAFQDSAKDVTQSLADLVEAGLIGLGLSVIVLFLFLNDVRMTLIVTAAIPLSIVITLGALYFMNLTLNILTLMGLMLSIGMLVDNSVVVTESIYKEHAALNPPPPAPSHKGRGNALRATLAGANSVGLAVTLGTLTTAIVFLPNIFGVQNEITIYLSHVAVTICIALAASLLVAITLIPQLTSRVLASTHGGARWIARFTERYARGLEWTLRHRGWTALFIVLVVASVAIPAKLVKSDFFQQNTSKRLFMQYNLNSVYPLAKVEAAVNTVESWLSARRQQLEYESMYSYFELGQAQTLLYLKPAAQRTRTGDQIQDEIRKGLPKLAIGEISFEQNRTGSNDKLAVQIYGEEAEHLREVGTEVADVLKRVPGLADVRLDANAGSWEVRVHVDRDKARLYGLSSQQVAEVVAGAMRGTPLKPFYTRQGETDMVLELRKADRLNLDALRALPIVSGDGRRVSLSTVATLSIGDVAGSIKREDRRTSATINFGTADGTTADEAKARIKAYLSQLQLPPGYAWDFGNAFDEDKEQQQAMIVNMVLAVACIYLVMAALFESVLAPSAIITGIVFSFIGVYWFFLLTHTVFSFMAMIGMLVLMGVVVNNGIVLIDHVHQLREHGMPREQAVVQGSRDRLRPILMTAASTVFGMLPLAVGGTTIGGDGPPYYPMARAVMGGLIFATAVSLLVLPTIYLMLDDLGHWGRRIAGRALSSPLPLAGDPSMLPPPLAGGGKGEGAR